MKELYIFIYYIFIYYIYIYYIYIYYIYIFFLYFFRFCHISDKSHELDLMTQRNLEISEVDEDELLSCVQGQMAKSSKDPVCHPLRKIC
jgi:hypothetical protein